MFSIYVFLISISLFKHYDATKQTTGSKNDRHRRRRRVIVIDMTEFL